MKRASGALLAALLGCQSDPTLPAPSPIPTGVFARPAPTSKEPRRETEEVRAPDGTLLRKRDLLVFPDGRRVRDGVDEEWYADGAARHRREYALGEPAGTWRSWHASGALRSEVHCDPATVGTSTWWNEDGTVAAQGPTRGGVKEGRWVHNHPDGSPAEEGAYAGGLRQGEWTLRYPGGALQARGTYRDGVRVGVWELWTPDGVRSERGGDAPVPER